MAEKSSYFLYGYFGAGNFGDDILLTAVIQNILAHDPTAKFLVRTHGPLDFLTVLQDRITPAPLEEVHKSNHTKLTKLYLLLRAYWSSMGKSHTLVIGGGTLIHDKPHLTSTFLMLILCLIARLRGTKVIGVGLGTKKITSPAGKFLVGCLLPLFDKIYLRDSDSLALCRRLCPHHTAIHLSTDLAYSLPLPPPAPKDRVIAVSLVDYMFSGPTTSARTLHPLSKILASLIESGHSIRFLSLQKSRPEDGSMGDTETLNLLHAILPAPLQAKCSFFELQPDAQSISAAYDSVCLTIGMRFHSLIFSAINECPFVGLAHEPKIDAMCKEYDLPSVPVDKMTYENLETAINSALLHPVSRDQIVRNQNLAQESFKSWTGVPS